MKTCWPTWCDACSRTAPTALLSIAFSMNEDIAAAGAGAGSAAHRVRPGQPRRIAVIRPPAELFGDRRNSTGVDLSDTDVRTEQHRSSNRHSHGVREPSLTGGTAKTAAPTGSRLITAPYDRNLHIGLVADTPVASGSDGLVRTGPGRPKAKWDSARAPSREKRDPRAVRRSHRERPVSKHCSACSCTRPGKTIG